MATDGELLARFIANREEDAFTEIVGRHGPMVVAACRRLVGSDADDAAQAAFLLLAKHAKRLAGRSDVGAWLHQAAMMVCRHILRERTRRKVREREVAVMKQAENAAQLNAPILRAEFSQNVDEAVAALPERYRQVVVLCCLEGRSQAEAATVLKLPLGTVKAQCARGLDKLRSELKRRGATLNAATVTAFLAEQAASAAAGFQAQPFLVSLKVGLSEIVALAPSAQGGVSAITAGARHAMPLPNAVPLQLVKGVEQMIFWSKAKTVAAVICLYAVFLGFGLPLSRWWATAEEAGGVETPRPTINKLAWAGTRLRPVPVLPDRPPVLLVRDGDKPSIPLKMSKFDVTARIVGFVAETKMTMTFQNENNRVMEGQLVFPLPEGATVSGYALDVNGQLVDGVAVEKEKARIVFETEVRKGVDPGLVEWVKGNNFQTRIYPISAGGSRTVMVRYVTETVEFGDDKKGWEERYYLPLNFKEALGEFNLRVEIAKGLGIPRITEGAEALGELKFEERDGNYAVVKQMKNVKPDKSLIVVLPDAMNKPVWVEKDAQDRRYFVVGDYPNPSEVESGNLPTIRSIHVLWDASHSRGLVNHDRELELLAKSLQKLAPQKVALNLFRDEMEPTETFDVKAGGIEKLLARLKTVAYDGGTQMGALEIRMANKDALPPDFILLFSDGLSTFGKDMPPLLPAPTYAFSADATANHPLLRHMASDSGGEYFNLNKLGDDQILKAVGAPPFSFISVTCNQGRIAETFPSGAQTVHGRFTLTGRLLSDEALITLNYGVAGKVLKRVPITITKQIPGETGILPTYWAQHKVDNLVVFPERNYAELLAVGKEYGLVTPATSLMVLERLDQYVQHEIEPPASLSQMRKDYLAQIAQKKAGEAKQKENKLNQVLAMWNERIKWWEMDFKYPVDFKYKEPEKEKTTTSVRVDYVLLLRQDLREEANKSVAGKVANGNNIEITLKPWNPETPYLKALQAAGVDQIYTVYLEQKKQHGGAPAFYLDCATLFFKNKQQALARRVLSNVAELMFEDPAMLRVLAYKLEEEGELELAAEVLERVLTLRPEEPQSYRDLALVYAKLKRWDRALKLLADVVLKSWDGRFNEVELIALTEFNRFLPQAESAGVKTARGLLDARLIRELPVDVRILLTWDADATDIDLWVIEPSDEKAFYGHRRTTIGGNVSRDFTQGYGPEEYLLKKTMPGKYKIQCNYYGSSQQKVQGPVTVKATVFVNYGRPNEEVKIMTLRLSDKKETVEIGEIKF